MSKHTPGPWSVDGAGIKAMVRGGNASIVAVRHRNDGNVNEADMRLIAAAPEMLEALNALVHNVTYLDVPNEIKDQIEAAMAKAEGRS